MKNYAIDRILLCKTFNYNYNIYTYSCYVTILNKFNFIVDISFTSYNIDNNIDINIIIDITKKVKIYRGSH